MERCNIAYVYTRAESSLYTSSIRFCFTTVSDKFWTCRLSGLASVRIKAAQYAVQCSTVLCSYLLLMNSTTSWTLFTSSIGSMGPKICRREHKPMKQYYCWSHLINVRRNQQKSPSLRDDFLQFFLPKYENKLFSRGFTSSLSKPLLLRKRRIVFARLPIRRKIYCARIAELAPDIKFYINFH